MMSTNSGPLAPSKGETTVSSKTSKSGYDHLDINKLYKGKQSEPAPKAVTQKHGMQTLGKALPARRPGAKTENTVVDTSAPATVNLQKKPLVPNANLLPIPPESTQGWTGNMPPSGPPPMSSGPPSSNVMMPPHPHIQDKNWSGNGPRQGMELSSQRFAQEFPSLESGDSMKIPQQPVNSASNSSNAGHGGGKYADNQYGPGPILRPQTEGSWTQGGSRGPNRPNSSGLSSGISGPNRDLASDRNKSGIPSPPLPLSQSSAPPPPLGSGYSNPGQYRGSIPPSVMHSTGIGNSNYGPGLPKFGFPIPSAPPPRSGSNDDRDRKEPPRSMRNQPSSKPSSHFTAKPIIDQDALKKMDEIGSQSKGWAAIGDTIDYDRKINFSDDDDEREHRKNENSKVKYGEKVDNKETDSNDNKVVRILERKTSTGDRGKPIDSVYDGNSNQVSEADDDRMRRKPFDLKDRDKDYDRIEKGRRPAPMEEDWRSASKNSDDMRGKRHGGGRLEQRPMPDYGSTNRAIAPRFLKQQQNSHSQYSQQFSQLPNQRQTPSPVFAGKDRPMDRDRGQHKDSYSRNRMMERKRYENDSNWEPKEKREQHYGESERGTYPGMDKDRSKKTYEKERKESFKKEMSPYESKQTESRSCEISSWADEVASEQDYEKGFASKKEPMIKNEEKKVFKEHSVARRVSVYPQRVENMTSDQTDFTKEKKQPIPETRKEEKVEVTKPSVPWSKDKDDLKSKETALTESALKKSDSSIDVKEVSKNSSHEPVDKNKAEDIRQEDKNKVVKNDDHETKSKIEPLARNEHDRVKMTSTSRWGQEHLIGKERKTPEKEFSISSSDSGSHDHLKEKVKKDDIIVEKSLKDKERLEKDAKPVTREIEQKDRRRDYRGHDPDDSEHGKENSRFNRGNRRDKSGYPVYQPRNWGDSYRSSRGRSMKGRPGGRDRDYYERDREKGKKVDYDDKYGPPSRHDKKEFEKSSESVENVTDSEQKKMHSSSEDIPQKNKKDYSSDISKKRSKSPINKRNSKGGARLQGYGPPSDKTPFSNMSKNEEAMKERSKDVDQSSKTLASSNSGGPVPLMELGDISPPNLHMRSRHYGVGGRGGRGHVNSRVMKDDGYAPRGRKNKNDAKPLMSLSSGDVDRNEWHSEDDEEDGKRGSKNKKESHGTKPISEKQRLTSKSSTGSEHNSSNESHKKSSNQAKLDTDSIGKSGTDGEAEVIDVSDGDGGFQEVKNKKAQPKERPSNPQKQTRIEKSLKEKERDKKLKNQNYDSRQPSQKDVPPRFNKNQSQVPASKNEHQSSEPIATKEPAPVPSGNAWDKPITLKNDLNSHVQVNEMGAANEENTNLPDKIGQSSSLMMNPQASINSASYLDGATPPIETLIFENTSYKVKSSQGIGDPKKEGILANQIEFGKDIPFFGKVSECPSELTFGTPIDVHSSEAQQQSVLGAHVVSKPVSINQTSRQFSLPHQPSPISPSADLNEKIQSVKKVWDNGMPSVAEQAIPDDSTFHSSFASETFKGSDSSRDFGPSSLQNSSSYTPGSSSGVSVIAKPDSSSSPTAASMRQTPIKSQQGSENQTQTGANISAFTYAVPHTVSSFGSAVPSPNLMSGSYPLPNQTYQHFSPMGTSHVLNVTTRSQYGQYPTTQSAGAGGGQYSLGSVFMSQMDQFSSLQHGSAAPGHHSQGQAPSTRLPSGTSTTSGEVSTSSVSYMNSSSGSMMNMKSQTATGMGPHGVPGSQQNYNQLSHPHPSAQMQHHQGHSIAPVGHSKSAFNQAIAPPSQPSFVYYNSDPVLPQNFMTSNLRNAPPEGPPPTGAPSVQAIQPPYASYSGTVGNQSVYPTGSNQVQQVHVVPSPQAMSNMQSATPHLGFPYTPGMGVQGYNTQATVSPLNVGTQIIRSGSTPYMKAGPDMAQPPMKSSHDSILNPGWTNPPFYQSGNKPSMNMNPQDRNNGNLSSQRNKGMMNSLNSMKGSGYPGQKPSRYPNPIQRPPTTSPSAGQTMIQVGSSSSHNLSGNMNSNPIGVNPGAVGGIKSNESES